MRSRALHIALLLVQALWLNVVVPGHRRGSVALPGERCGSCEQGAGVAAVPPCCRSHASQTGAGHLPAPIDPARHCAICNFAAHLSIPPAIDLSLPPLGLLGMAPRQRMQYLPRVCLTATYDGRAPPSTHVI
ncbi:MAG TPA: hypothetical protein VFC78_14170 [Tepidisphaeraceae bacterium]|nr:hypothetical protein [Tepidisphaeraceae bacterium]